MMQHSFLHNFFLAQIRELHQQRAERSSTRDCANKRRAQVFHNTLLTTSFPTARTRHAP